MNEHDQHQDGKLDVTDERLVEAMRASAPRAVPEGFVERIVQASLPALASGRARGAARLRLSVFLGRVAVAAMLGVAIVLGFWSSPSARMHDGAFQPVVATMDAHPATTLLATGPSRGVLLTLLATKDVNYDAALGDLETVVHVVGTGQDARLGLVGEDTTMDRMEAELITVTDMTGGHS